MSNDILIINSTIMPLSQNGAELIENGFISIKDGAISALGPMAELPDSSMAEKTIDANSKAFDLGRDAGGACLES